MGFLDKFGRGVKDVAGRAKSRFSNDVEPIEIASKLRETMDKRAASFVHLFSPYEMINSPYQLLP